MNEQKKLAKRAGNRKSLWIIAALLVVSGLVRFSIGPGQALAKEVAALTPDQSEAAEQSCENDPVTAEILAVLSERENAVAERERIIGDRQQSISFAEIEIQKNLRALEAAENSLSATMNRARTASEEDLSRLTAVYENMKPKDASVLFEQMAPQFAAGFVARMRPDAAAKIMTGLNPERAYSISVILAGRNALTPTE